MNQQTCNPAWLDAFLKNELNESEEQMLTSHLDECSDCREELESRAAEQSVWREASNLLGEGILLSTAAISDIRSGTVRSPQIDLVLQQLAPTDDPESLGRIGGYEVTGVVGAGGMGVVLKAHDRSLDRIVAIKVMSPHLASSGSARRRFAREAKAAAAVLHPNVIAIHSVASEDANPFLVMPYVRGASLQKRIDSQGPLPLKDTLRIGAQIAAGLAAAHEQGLVHRDIKPANILLEEGVERVTITDFGLARAVDDASMTCSGVIAGTPQYMSPEQTRGEPIDARSDLFSLGSVLYAMCAGRSPFRAETTYGVLHRIANDNPTPVCEVNTDVPVWLGHIIERLMTKRPEDRFESAAQVAELLEGCLAHVQQPAAIPLPETVGALAPKKSRRPPIGKFIATAAGAFALFFAGIMIVLELGKGTLTIESELDDVPIRIMQGDEVVKSLTVSKEGATTRIGAGKYIVEIGQEFDKAVIKDGGVDLSRGATVIVKVTQSNADTAADENAKDEAGKAWLSATSDGSNPVLNSDQFVRQTRENLEQIALAFHNYHEEQGHLPGFASVDGNGSPMLSWRVHLLPYMGDETKALHSEFRLNEAWDSPHNRGLIARMPSVYSVPLADPLATGHTCYVVPRSDLTLFPDHARGIDFSDIYQGLPNIVLVVEGDRDVATAWTKPADLPFDRKTPLAHLGNLRDGGFLVSWASGKISFIPNLVAAHHQDRTEFLRGLFEQVGGRGVEYYLDLPETVEGAKHLSTAEDEKAKDEAAKAWLRRPVAGRTRDGKSYQLAGHDALMDCVMRNNTETLNRLLTVDKYDLDFSPRDGQWTLLQIALLHECVETSSLLLRHGANPNFASKGTPLPLELAKRSGRKQLVALVQKYLESVAPHPQTKVNDAEDERSRIQKTADSLVTITFAGTIDGASVTASGIGWRVDDAGHILLPSHVVAKCDDEAIQLRYASGEHCSAKRLKTLGHLTLLKSDQVVNGPAISLNSETSLTSGDAVSAILNGTDNVLGSIVEPRKTIALSELEGVKFNPELRFQNIITTDFVADDTTLSGAPLLTKDGDAAGMIIRLGSAQLIAIPVAEIREVLKQFKQVANSDPIRDHGLSTESMETRTDGRFGILKIIEPTSLEDAVTQFNLLAKEHPLGLTQPGLTVEEMTAAFRLWIASDECNEATRKDFQQVLDTQMLRPGHILQFNTKFETDGHLFDIRNIRGQV